MSYLAAVGITVGFLAGAWVYLSGELSLIGFVGFLGWASYFAAGGGTKAARSAFCTNMSGILWGVLNIALSSALPGVPGIAFTILFAAIMCWQAKLGFLGFIPGTFIGNAAFYASGNNWQGTAVALTCGIGLGLLSDVLAKKMSEKKQAGTDPL